ncbi:hypothetical protein ACF06V_37990 [Streptomyces bobili]
MPQPASSSTTAPERAAALAEVGAFLAGLVAEQDLWPGDGLLTPLARRP